MKELQNSENPYAPPIHVPSAVTLPSFETGGRAERRIWMINSALLIATIPAGVGALVFIRP